MKTFENAVEEAMKEPQIEFKTENGPLNSNSGRSAVLFYYSTSLINGLKYKQINELFDHFSKQSGEKGDLMK